MVFLPSASAPWTNMCYLLQQNVEQLSSVAAVGTCDQKNMKMRLKEYENLVMQLKESPVFGEILPKGGSARTVTYFPQKLLHPR